LDSELVTAGTLYVLATPLGNLGDLSDRAREVLRMVSLVAAEDTRRARVLLTHVDATPRVVSFHAHSAPSRLAAILESLEAGEDVALLADAGTPTVSDPGSDLVREARRAGAAVVSVPGPSAVAAALSVSGLPADRFSFLGFPPRKGRDRRRLLEHAASAPWTTVFFEAPTRLVRLLHDLAQTCGEERPVAVARELTKVYEEVRTGTLKEVAGYYEEKPPRGEVTVVVGAQPQREARPLVDETEARDRALALLEEGLSRRDAADRLAEELSMARREAYRIVTNL
jgi:16S rRNA (cytidine1402-2'-O)-methyltransferase